MATGTADPRWHPASSHQRLGLTVGKRSYPWSSVTVQTAEGAPPLSEFAQEIVDRLREKMVYFETQGRHVSYTDLLNDVLSSARVVEEAVREFRDFLEQIAETNLVLGQEGFGHDGLRAQTYTKACREFVEESRVWEALPYPNISARREGSRTMAQHDEEHVRELEVLLVKFALLVERTLDQLVSCQLVGVVQWGTERSCDFHFFNTVVIQRVHQRYTVQRELFSRVVHDNHLYTQRDIGIEERRHIVGESEFRHARTDVYLRDANVRRIEYIEHRIPQKFAKLARSVPWWLRDKTTVIEGYRFSEEMIVSTTRKEDFDIQDGPATMWVQSTFTPNSPEGWRLLNPVYDPALVIGNHYVVAGWGPQEEEAAADEAAVARSQSVRKRRSEHLRDKQRIVQLCAVMLVVVGLLMIMFSRQNPQLMLMLASVSALSSLAAFGYAFRLGKGIWQSGNWDTIVLYVGQIGCLLVGIYFLTLAFIVGSLPLGAVGGVALLILGAMLRYLPKATPIE